ncbi:malto-oligosyltrehalose trehalohydrolase [Candidatus Binatus sp.]|uniref:malto-oligosyltrehalose trehalohydrolase n=1 Tax=Candidatus Binatus sp. TaxID=2811406 RepID=UPI003C46F4AF
MNRRIVWAPSAASVAMVTANERVEMHRASDGWWRVELSPELSRADYAFSLDGGPPLPDPRSPYQPHGVHGLSRPVDHSAFEWRNTKWQAATLSSAIIYECHIGTFTSSGTFDAVIERLGHLRELGVTHIELMPVAEFSGARGWGYDGVDLFAPHHSYGGPDAMKRFIDAAHGHGLGVILDVVYNHLGPEGSYLAKFGPYFTNRYRTPWGDAVNLDDRDSDKVRRFFCDNALMWLRDYRVDGLRLDAIHAIFDASAIHFLEQLGAEVHQLEAEVGRHLFVIAESDLNQPQIVAAREAGGYGLDAQWNDDFHHALHTILTGETAGYLADFGSIAQLAKCVTRGFVYDGTYSKSRRRTHGRPVLGLSAHRFVAFMQNHDQVGNRAMGERLGHLVTMEQLKISATLLMTSPFIPMLFQGEEWNASSPFQYFTDHQDSALAESVRKGRRAEFAHFVADASEVPDPQALQTFERSKLDWDERERDEHREIFEWYRQLIALRRRVRDFEKGELNLDAVKFDEAARWICVSRGESLVICNFATSPQRIPIAQEANRLRVALASKHGVRVDGLAIELPPVSVAILAPEDGARSTGGFE